MSDYILVLSTVNNKNVAQKIAEQLVEQKLCACVNILPEMLSVYSWKNNIEKDKEFLMLIKTRRDLFLDLKNEIIKLHPYEIPEIISFDIEDGNEAYLSWLNENTKD